MNTRKLKVATIVGTRPEIIRLSRVMSALDEHCEHTLVHTGQNVSMRGAMRAANTVVNQGLLN